MAGGTRLELCRRRDAETEVQLRALVTLRLEEERWEFRCECGDPECREYVLLSLPEYEALGDRGGTVLAPGHEISRIRATRERSVELRSEAAALKAQARHQAARAKRNLERARSS